MFFPSILHSLIYFGTEPLLTCIYLVIGPLLTCIHVGIEPLLTCIYFGIEPLLTFIHFDINSPVHSLPFPSIEADLYSLLQSYIISLLHTPIHYFRHRTPFEIHPFINFYTDSPVHSLPFLSIESSLLHTPIFGIEPIWTITSARCFFRSLIASLFIHI